MTGKSTEALSSSPVRVSQSLSTIREKGKTLCDRAELLYHRSQQLVPALKQIKNSPARVVCAFSTLVGGLGLCSKGELMMGVPVALSGAKEVWNLSRPADDSNLQRTLKNIQADAGMVSTLLEANQESYRVMDGNLSEISAGVAGLHTQLNEISQISGDADQQIQVKKQEALELNQQAVSAYGKALNLFQTAQRNLNTSTTFYEQCGKSFQRMGEIVGNEDPQVSLEAKIHELVQVSSAAAATCRSAKALLDQTTDALAEAMQALTQANRLRDQATLAYGQTIQLAQDTFKHIQEKAQITDQCQAKIAATRQELQKVQHRSDQIMRLIEDLKEEVIRAQDEAQGKLGVSEVAVGVAVGTLCAPLGTASIPLGVAAAYTYHNSTTISSGAKKIYHWVYGISTPKAPEMAQDELIRARFDETSSGWMGYLKRRPSSTVGTLDLNLGDEVIPVRFDLNQSHQISRMEMLKVFEVMNQKVSEGKMDPQRCLNVLDQLERITISRGSLHPPARGLIKRTQASYAVFELLRDVCQERLRVI